VAANYIATDTRMEAKVDIPQNEPSVLAVRETAIQTLEARGAPAPPPAGSQAPRPNGAGGAGSGGTGQPSTATPPANSSPTAAITSGASNAGSNNGNSAASP